MLETPRQGKVSIAGNQTGFICNKLVYCFDQTNRHVGSIYDPFHQFCAIGDR